MPDMIYTVISVPYYPCSFQYIPKGPWNKKTYHNVQSNEILFALRVILDYVRISFLFIVWSCIARCERLMPMVGQKNDGNIVWAATNAKHVCGFSTKIVWDISNHPIKKRRVSKLNFLFYIVLSTLDSIKLSHFVFGHG